jgi:hypothetical protein
MAVTSTPVPSWDTPTAARKRCLNAFTADTETGDYIDDPSADQVRDLIASLGQVAGTFVALTPASEDGADEWAYARPYATETERRQALDPWLRTYNHHRGLTALKGLPPASRVTNLAGQYT